MVQIVGRNRNVNDTAVVSTVNVGTGAAVTLAAPNPLRTYLRVDLAQGVTDRDVYIRLYPASDDNILRGILLSRKLSLNDTLFQLFWEMQTDNIYTGEISAIGLTSTTDVYITEY